MDAPVNKKYWVRAAAVNKNKTEFIYERILLSTDEDKAANICCGDIPRGLAIDGVYIQELVGSVEELDLLSKYWRGVIDFHTYLDKFTNIEGDDEPGEASDE